MTKPPEWLKQMLPDNVNSFLESGGWYGLLAVVGILAALILWKMMRGLFRGAEAKTISPNLREDFSEYPPLPPNTGDRRLLADGVPVRLRLVVLAPSGKDATISPDAAYPLLERLVPGLGEVAKQDKPRIRIWPMQLSYDGFANVFHRSTPVPEGENQPTPWVLFAGRTPQAGILLGVGLQALKATTIARKTLNAHEWPSVLRVRVRD